MTVRAFWGQIWTHLMQDTSVFCCLFGLFRGLLQLGRRLHRARSVYISPGFWLYGNTMVLPIRKARDIQFFTDYTVLFILYQNFFCELCSSFSSDASGRPVQTGAVIPCSATAAIVQIQKNPFFSTNSASSSK